MATAPNVTVEPVEPVEPQLKRMRASPVLFGEEGKKVGPAEAHPDSGSSGSSGSTIQATHAFRAAHGHGVRLTLKGEHIECTSERAPNDDLLGALREHKPAIVAILRGDACRRCGTALAWPAPVGVTFLDGTSECQRCADGDVERRFAAAGAEHGGAQNRTRPVRRGHSVAPVNTWG